MVHHARWYQESLCDEGIIDYLYSDNDLSLGLAHLINHAEELIPAVSGGHCP
jgi:hypothetical protein